MKRRTLVICAAVLALLAAPAAAEPASASARSGVEVSPGWAAWYGCWRPLATDGVAADHIVCVLPGDDASSARMVTYEDGNITAEELLRADGVGRPVEEGGCAGEETASWSRDGRRVFLRTELDCGGLKRVSTGVLALVAENEWLDAQVLTMGEQHASRALRYRALRADAVPAEVLAALPRDRQLMLEAARLEASAPLDIDAVIEASRQIAAPAVEALLASRQHGFGLNARKLAQLEASGVPASVIDVMVALSYPGTFAVQPRTSPEGTSAWRPAGSRYYADECIDPFYPYLRYRGGCDPWGYGYSSRYGYNRYGYSPWGYNPYGWNYGGQPIVVIIAPGEDRPGTEPGRIVRGQGYTRGGTPSSRGTAQPRTAEPSGSSAASRPATTTSSPPSGASTSSGRTAVPRPATTGGGGGGGQ
jgi:hypothetical protein